MALRQPPKQLLVSRADAAMILGASVDLIKKLEREGKLEARRLTSSKGGVYPMAQILALAGVTEEEMSDAR
jgi:hypothetical protein